MRHEQMMRHDEIEGKGKEVSGSVVCVTLIEFTFEFSVAHSGNWFHVVTWAAGFIDHEDEHISKMHALNFDDPLFKLVHV